jgi:hypothetical protein
MISGRAHFTGSCRAIPLKALGGIFSVLALNPFPIVTGAVAVWLVAQMVGGIARLQAEGHAWEACDALGCGAYLAALAATIVLATGHIALSMRAGWSAGRRPTV